MLNMTNYSINGNSDIDGLTVAYFSASYSDNNSSYNMSVNDRKAYDENKVTVDADYEQFKLKADEYAEGVGVIAKEE